MCKHIKPNILLSLLPRCSIFCPDGTDNPFSEPLILCFQHNFLDIPNYNQMGKAGMSLKSISDHSKETDL